MDMGKMIDMRLPKKKETARLGGTVQVSPAREDYPWGLQLHLDNEACKKIGLNCSQVKVGEIMPMGCMVKVIGTNETDTTEGKRIGIDLQITKIAMDKDSTAGDKK